MSTPHFVTSQIFWFGYRNWVKNGNLSKDEISMTEEQVNNSIEQKVERMLEGSSTRRSPMIARRKEKFDFWQIYGMVLGLLIIVIGAGLGFLWQSLLLYDKSLPERALEQFRHPLIQGGVPRIVVYEAAKPAKYESAMDKDSFIRDILAEGELTFTHLEGESSEDREVYLCKAGETDLAAVTLEKIHAGRYGHWEAVDEESRMPIYGDMQIIAPQGALVTINGVALFDEDLITSGLPYDELASLPFGEIAVPAQDEYAIRGLYREPEIEALGVEGNVLDIARQEDENGVFIRIVPNAAEEGRLVLQKMGLADAQIFCKVRTGDAEASALTERMTAGAKAGQDLQAAQGTQVASYPAHNESSFSNEAVSRILLYSTDCLGMDIEYTCTLTDEDGESYVFDDRWTFYYLKIGDVWMIADILPRETISPDIAADGTTSGDTSVNDATSDDATSALNDD